MRGSRRLRGAATPLSGEKALGCPAPPPPPLPLTPARPAAGGYICLGAGPASRAAPPQGAGNKREASGLKPRAGSAGREGDPRASSRGAAARRRPQPGGTRCFSFAPPRPSLRRPGRGQERPEQIGGWGQRRREGGEESGWCGGLVRPPSPASPPGKGSVASPHGQGPRGGSRWWRPPRCRLLGSGLRKPNAAPGAGPPGCRGYPSCQDGRALKWLRPPSGSGSG